MQGWLLAHLKTPPFPNLQVSPLGLVPKKAVGNLESFSICLHLKGNPLMMVYLKSFVMFNTKTLTMLRH